MTSFSNHEVEQVLRNVFEKRCVQCENIAPTCENGCPTGTLCSLAAYDLCDECPRAECIVDPDFKGTPAEQGNAGPNVGAIAGGVIGGVAVILVLVWLLWRFFIRDRRRQQEVEEEQWEASDNTTAVEKMDSDQFTMRRDARNSTHTVASVASSILTRASNVIQIAYIPGITNRGGPESPDVLVPPVPPIPLALSHGHGSAPNSPYASTEDSHYFMPSDLRDSSYTAYSDDPRNSYATRASITPSLARSSVATTIYRNDAVVDPMPATTIVRGKAAMVSVRNKDGSTGGSPASTPGAETPPLPSAAHHLLRQHQAPVQIKMPSSGPKSKNANVMSTAQMGKPVALTLTKKKASNSSLLSSSASSLAPASALDPRDLGAVSPRPQTATSEASESDFEDEHARSRRSLLGHDRRDVRGGGADSPVPSPQPGYSPFQDMSSSIGSPLRSLSRPGVELATVQESPESSRRVSPEHSRRGSKEVKAKGKSPFGDENALR